LRFCNKLNYSVVGGASKLFKHFIKNNKPKNIISYSDNRYFDGSLYEKLGFIKEGILREAFYKNDKYINGVIYSKLKADI